MNLRNGKPVVRCSSLDQLLSCPGSRTLNALIGDVDEDDSASWEGQFCHHAAARYFVDKHGALEPEGGLPLPQIPKDYKPDGFAEWIIDYYQRAVMEDTPGDWAMEVESEMVMEFPSFWLSGHCDVNAVSPDGTELNFDDLKTGANIVDVAECNWQVLGYAVLFKLTYPSLKKIRGRIIQPRVREDEGQRISGVVFDEKGTTNTDGQYVATANVHEIVPLLAAKVDEALRNTTRLVTGLKQCRWCLVGNQFQCPALNAELEAMTLELTPALLAAIKATPDDQALLRWALAKKLLGPKLEKGWELLKERLAKVGTIEGPNGESASLKDWQGAREIRPEGKSKVWEEPASTLDEQLAYECMEISLPAAERALAKRLDLPIESKKAEADSGKRQVERRFAGFITRKQGKQLTLSA